MAAFPIPTAARLRDAFPNVKVIAAAATVGAIKGSVEKKLAVWGPKLKENGPQALSDVVLPEAFDGSSLTVDGEIVEIIAGEGLANRRYLWVPSLKAVFGGVMIFSGVHVWTADTQTAELRAAWIANLDKIAARKPAVVVAGHTTPDAATDLSGIAHTKAYLVAFEEELAKAKDGAGLTAAMEARFPNLGMDVALDIGSKFAMVRPVGHISRLPPPRRTFCVRRCPGLCCGRRTSLGMWRGRCKHAARRVHRP
jgi:glyoxylase-like metal-dependent hydrolase (beta-lactamase superfamily II)